MGVSAIHSMMEALRKDDGGIVTSVKELKENQYGFPLAHYAQQYLFGATGLRIKVFNSISGMPQACKSPLLFDLMGHLWRRRLRAIQCDQGSDTRRGIQAYLQEDHSHVS